MPSDRESRLRDGLLVALALTTGATDATAFERLGHVFASVITGNLVLLGVSAAQANGRLALSAGCALGGYAIGTVICAPSRSEGDHRGESWPSSATAALAVDLALLCGFAVAWELAAAHPTRSLQVVLVGVAAAAMGVQSVAVRRLGAMSTTYLTSTLTGLLESLRTRRWSPVESRSSAILLSAAAGAAAATLLVDDAGRWLPVLQLVPLAAVIVVALAAFGRTPDPRAHAADDAEVSPKRQEAPIRGAHESHESGEGR